MNFGRKNTMCAAVHLTAGLLLFATSLAHAQQSSGTYTLMVGGSAVSTETYALVSKPDVALHAEAEICIIGSKRKTTTAFSKNRLVSYLALAGETKLLSAAFDDSGVKLQISGQEEQQLTTKAYDGFTARDAAGHSDIRTTGIYARPSIERVRKAVNSLSDGAQIQAGATTGTNG